MLLSAWRGPAFPKQCTTARGAARTNFVNGEPAMHKFSAISALTVQTAVRSFWSCSMRSFMVATTASCRRAYRETEKGEGVCLCDVAQRTPHNQSCVPTHLACDLLVGQLNARSCSLKLSAQYGRLLVRRGGRVPRLGEFARSGCAEGFLLGARKVRALQQTCRLWRTFVGRALEDLQRPFALRRRSRACTHAWPPHTPVRPPMPAAGDSASRRVGQPRHQRALA